MSDLTDFLLARIDEDEEWARWAGAVQDAERSRGLAFVSSLGSSSVTSAGRVLAECEAKRKIVAEARDYSPELEHGDNGEWAFDATLRALTLPYADHADYDASWRP
jgi:hypothetical protein